MEAPLKIISGRYHNNRNPTIQIPTNNSVLDLRYILQSVHSRANTGVVYFKVVLLLNMSATGNTFTPCARDTLLHLT